MSVRILGAGLSGLIAATQFPSAIVQEASQQHAGGHRALLRFRTPSVGLAVGIPFRKVKVHKSIWSNGNHCHLNIQMANWYSQKTRSRLLDQSIWNIEPVERYIAPEDFIQQLIDKVGFNRIQWGHEVSSAELNEMAEHKLNIISTIPLPAVARLLAVPVEAEFARSSIAVDRYRIANANVYQTIYYPDLGMYPYRASITGNLLIVERMGGSADASVHHVLESFGLMSRDVTPLDVNYHQRYGKIVPIDEQVRTDFIYNATINHNVFSLGRFATWRNILLDDVLHDVEVIKQLITRGSRYSATLKHHQR